MIFCAIFDMKTGKVTGISNNPDPTSTHVEISRELSRVALMPSDDISDQPDEVKTFCNAVWTDAVKTEWANYLEYQKTVGIGTSY